MKNNNRLALSIIYVLCGLFCSCSDEGRILLYQGVNYEVSGGKAYAIGTDFGSYYDIIVYHNVNGYEVVGITDSAFAGKEKLREVKIEEGIKSIGRYAFANCIELDEIYLPNSLDSISACSFKNCKKLKQIILPNSLVYIGDSAFYDTELEKISFPKKLKEIGKYAFAECELWKGGALCFPEGLTKIEEGAFDQGGYSEVIFPTSLEYIGKRAFHHHSMNSLYITENIKHIGEQAFGACTVYKIDISPYNKDFIVKDGCLLSKDKKRLILATKAAVVNNVLKIPDGVEIIEKDGIFIGYDWTDVKKVNLPNTLKKLSQGSVFTYGCYYDLKQFHIPASVECIEEKVFNGDLSFASFDVEPANKYFCSQDGVLYNKSKTRLIIYPPKSQRKKFVIPSTVESIDSCAFEHCENLYTIDFNEVKVIGSETCKRSWGIEEFICLHTDTIKYDAFDFCAVISRPKKIHLLLGRDIKYLNAHAFLSGEPSCIVCYAEEPPYIDGENLNTEKDCKIYVPLQSVYSYQRDEKWGKFKIYPIQQ